MAPQPGLDLGGRYGLRIEQFADLMSRRVLEVLLVASEYDAFAFEEDGHLTERVSKEYRELDLNMRYAPRFVRARDGAQALQWLSDRRFDLVVTTARLADMELAAFCRAVKDRLPELPIGVVAAHAWDLARLDGVREPGGADLILLWEGDPKTLLALIKLVEDRWNADRDILEGGVQAIVLVEDEVRSLSALLPRLFSEVMLQTGRLADEGLNLSHRLLRARARPKLLLARTFEEALALYERYAANVLGLVSDCSFPRGGAADPEAGCALVEAVRARDPFVPVLLMSSEADYAAKAAALRVAFVHKEVPTAFDDVRRHLIEDFGFGDFVFRMPDGAEVARARDLRELVPCLERVPEESLRFHADRNHFSRWLKARTELEVAAMLRPLRPTDFADLEAIRKYLIGTLTYYLRYLQRHATTDFDPARYDAFVAFSRIAAGSLGGKGRGLAFMHKLLAGERPGMEGVEVAIPQTAVIATDAYEEFVETNRLHDVIGGAGDGLPDCEVLDRFRRGRFPGRRRGDFAAFLQQVRDPIAVRSSGILEDSAYQPFAGVYATVMLPNNHPSLDVRLAQLLEAVKVVYASASLRAAREG
ncbi:MAG: hypothetical protein FJ087_15115, partial [Deltaproteobacteria bacterium]|nr:hypothetical protein [Deltaproteobacteria bacterium]